jgi:Do/DeqQ family serine protease
MRKIILSIVLFLPLMLYAQVLTPEGKSPFVEASKKVMPAVVNISAERIIKVTTSPFYGDPFYDFFRDFFPQFPREYEEKSLGSGVLISKDGLILTNNHLVARASDIIVKTKEETYRDVEIVGADPSTDVAVLKVKNVHALPYAELGDSDSLEVGDWVMAIGNPLSLGWTLTAGIVSAKGRSGLSFGEGTAQLQDFIQTDAAINPGNSGGPLVNLEGKVVGINTAIATGSAISRGNIGIGFAIPINIVKAVAEDLIEYGVVSRGYLGIDPGDISSDMAEAMGLENAKGALVQDVVKGTPAAEAGIEQGDVIVEFDGKEVTSENSLRLVVGNTPPGKIVNVKVIRDGRYRTFRVKVGKRSSDVTPERWLGMEVAGIEGDGVRITYVESGSSADAAGLRVGDTIKKIGGKQIKGVVDYREAISMYSEKEVIAFLIERSGRERFVAIRPK